MVVVEMAMEMAAARFADEDDDDDEKVLAFVLVSLLTFRRVPFTKVA